MMPSLEQQVPKPSVYLTGLLYDEFCKRYPNTDFEWKVENFGSWRDGFVHRLRESGMI